MCGSFPCNETGLGGYITGGGFTFPGRFYVFWTSQRAAYSTSLSDIGTCSVKSSHPSPWVFGRSTSRTLVLQGIRQTRRQRPSVSDLRIRALQMFTLTGVWRTKSEPVFCCAVMRFSVSSGESATVGIAFEPGREKCASHVIRCPWMGSGLEYLKAHRHSAPGHASGAPVRRVSATLRKA